MGEIVVAVVFLLDLQPIVDSEKGGVGAAGFCGVLLVHYFMDLYQTSNWIIITVCLFYRGVPAEI